MPYTLNGFGTKYYGRREGAEDGSYITTLWVTALYVPLVPLGSYRVLPVGKGTNYVVHTSQSYYVNKVPLCWEQVWHVYMVGAPIILIAVGLMWSSLKDELVKHSLQADLKAAGAEIETARSEVDKLETTCLEPLKSREEPKPEFAALRQDLRIRCVPVGPAIDRYAAKIDRIQVIIGKGLADKSLNDQARNELITYQATWRIRRHQAEETKQVTTCLESLTHECYQNVSSLFDALEKEDKQVCLLLTNTGDKCE